MARNDGGGRAGFNPEAIDDLFEEIGIDGKPAAGSGPPAAAAAVPHKADAVEQQPPPQDADVFDLAPEVDEGESAADVEGAGLEDEEDAELVVDERVERAEDEADAEQPEPTVPAGPPATPAEAREMIDRLAALEIELKDVAEEAKSAPVVESARADLERASDVLDRFPKDDPTFDILRDELLDAYFTLDRLVHPKEDGAPVAPEERRRRPPGQPKKKRKTKAVETVGKKKAAPRVSRTTIELRQARRRVAVMVALTVLLGAGRVAYFFAYEQGGPSVAPQLEQKSESGSSTTRLKQGGRLAKDASRGVPIVTFLRLARTGSGGLVAAASAIDADSPKIKLTFKWFKDDKIFKVEEQGVLEPGEVAELSIYKVEVTATDGKLTSAALVSAPLKIDPPSKPASSAGSGESP